MGIFELKIKCASPKIKLGDVVFNSKLIANEIEKAEAEGVSVLLLPELCLCGYSLRDMLGNPSIVSICQREIAFLAKASSGMQVMATVGFPFYYRGTLYNSVAVISDGKIMGIVPKSALPQKSPFGENRVFGVTKTESSTIEAFSTQIEFGTDLVFNAKGGTFGVVIGNARDRVDALLEKGADAILNPTAELVTVTMEKTRVDLAKELSYRKTCVFASCNASEGESTTDGLFTAHSVICQNGIVLAKKKVFDSEASDPVCEIDIYSVDSQEPQKDEEAPRNPRFPFMLDNKEQMDKRCELILNIQAHALARRLESTYSKAMVVGISGGLDSTLALIVMAKAADLLGWDRKNIIAITMPCFGTTARTKSNATALCNELGVTLREIDILEATRVHLRDIGHDENNHNVAYENAQARERTQILMDVANDIGGIVVGTGDLSEVALGWATYNGDHMAMYNVNSDIPKTLVRCVVDYFARNTEQSVAKILFDILDTPVSPELLPPCENGEIEQKTEDLVGPYELHDFFLYHFAGKVETPSKIYKLAKVVFENKYDDDTIYKWLTVFIKRFVTQQFKRSASPEGIKVGSVSLSPRGDFMMPSDMSYQAFLAELEAEI